MISKRYIYIVFILIMISCSKSKKSEIIILKKAKKNVESKEFDEFKKTKYFSSDFIIEQKFKVLKSGNKFAYANLVLFYSYNKSKKIEILPYSLIMVEKHKKYNYCSNIFENFLEFYTGQEFGNYYDGTDESLINYLKNINLLNKEEKNYILYFLNLGANYNDINSVSYLEILNRNGLGIEKNLKKADSLKVILNELKKKNDPITQM